MQLPLTAPPWHLVDSVGTSLVADPTVPELKVNWPLHTGAKSLNGLMTNITTDLTQISPNKIVQSNGIITGLGAIFPVDSSDQPPPKIRHYFIAASTKRWYSVSFFIPQAVGANVPWELDTGIGPDAWTDVNGQHGTANFARWLSDFKAPLHIGFAFGGNSFAEHGQAMASGMATFHLRGFGFS